jgi:hypothetical protein
MNFAPRELAHRPRVRNAARLGSGVAILGSLAAFVITQAGRLPHYRWEFHAPWLLLSAACLAVLYVAQAEIWRRILGELHGRLDRGPAQAVYAKSLLGRYMPTNLMMVIGRVLMAQRHGVPRRVTLASTIYEAALSLFAAVLVGAYFVITLPSLRDMSARWTILAVIPATLVAMHPAVFHRLANRALRRFGREQLPSSLGFGQVLATTGMYAVTWVIAGVGVFAFAAAVQAAPADHLSLIASSFAITYFVSVITFIVPSGIGTRDAALAAMLTTVFPGTVAIAIAIGFRLFQTAVELLYVGSATAVEWARARRG